MPTAGSHFRVVVRARPTLSHEREEGFIDGDGVEINGNVIAIQGDDALTAAQVFTFDAVFGPSCGQDRVYEGAAQPAVLSTVEGFNATIFAYGQTGSGKVPPWSHRNHSA